MNGSLGKLSINFINFIVEEVHLLLIVEVESVSSLDQFYCLRNYLSFRIFRLSEYLKIFCV